MLLRRTLVPVLVPLVLAGLGAGSGRADEETTRIPLPHPVPNETDFYGVYQGREKVGWAMLSLEWTGEGDEARYLSRTRIEATLAGPTGYMEFAFRTTDTFRGTPPFELLRSHEVRREGSRERLLELERREDGYEVSLTEGGVTEVQRLPALDYTLADRLTHVHWAQRSLEPGAGIHVAELDITELRPDLYTYRVEKLERVPSYAITVPAFAVAMRSERKGPLGTLLIDTDGRMLRGPLAGVAEVRLEPERQARERRLASDLLAFGRVPTTEKLGEARAVTDLVIAVYGRGADRFAPGPRQAVGRDAEGDPLLTLGAAVPAVMAASETEVAESLRAADTYPADAPPVVALARRAVGEASEPRAQVDALVRFVADHVTDLTVLGETPVLELVAAPAGDATEHARLFVALARALAIPAREVMGLVYLGDRAQAFGGHVWCEVVLDGEWVPVDPTWRQTETDATHVRWSTGAGDWVAMLAATRHLTFEIRRFVTRED